MKLSATSIIGDKVNNPDGEHLGKIEDLMVDVRTGDVSYAVVSFGGFMGFGEKLFAIPLQQMAVDTDDHKLILNVPKEKLDNAPGFDKDNWPASSDSAFHNSVHTYYV